MRMTDLNNFILPVSFRYDITCGFDSRLAPPNDKVLLFSFWIPQEEDQPDLKYLVSDAKSRDITMQVREINHTENIYLIKLLVTRRPVNHRPVLRKYISIAKEKCIGLLRLFDMSSMYAD